MEFTCRLCCWCVKCFISRANRREDSAEKGNKAVCWLTQGPVRTSGRLEPVLTDRTGQREKPTMSSSDLIQFDSGPVLLSEPLTGITATVRLSDKLQLSPGGREVQLPTIQNREEPDYIPFT